jgi:uncharacterized protein (TIGR02118 family)
MLYRNTPDAQFDFDYYVNTHLVDFKRRMSEFSLSSFEVQKCISTMRGDPPDYLCITHLDFDDRDRMTAGFAKHGTELKAAFAEYTNVQPEITVCKIASSG